MHRTSTSTAPWGCRSLRREATLAWASSS
uniref:Uncharacterized protein n=1 Tax=Arundo donax TaxID=35708 RepID=A0A0A9EGV9_ARUDO